MKKSLLATFLVTLTLCGLVFVGGVRFGAAQAGTQVSGIVGQDTSWTKANSPYNLAGPVLVKTGVTLTVEPGVAVNLNGFYIQVNGTLLSRGSSAEKITYVGGEIRFTNSNDTIGSVVEQNVVDFIRITFASPTISDSSVTYIQVYGGGPTIENNNITGSNAIPLSLEHNTIATVTNNRIAYSSDSIYMDLSVGGMPTIANNTIAGGIQVSGYGGSALILNNAIGASNVGNGNDPKCSVYIERISAVITGNNLSGNINLRGRQPIIGDTSASATISNNILSGGGIKVGGTAIVQNNIIKDVAGPAIIVWSGSLIQNNTISNNQIGIQQFGSVNDKPSTIIFNNIVGNSNYNVYWSAASNGNLSYNWWGTTDVQAINRSIYDFKNDFNLGDAIFIPLLTEPNTQATPNSNAPVPSQSPTAPPTPTSTPTSTPSSSASPTPTVPEFPPWAIFPLSLITAFTATIIVRRKRPKQS